ncbi:MAG: ComEC/Rec2 family competence protein [Rhodospirillales bacterium]
MLLAERPRWIYWLPAACGVGIALYFALPEEPSAGSGMQAALAAAAAALFALCLRNAVWARWTMLLTAAALTGFAAAQWRTQSLMQPQMIYSFGPAAIEGRTVRFEPYPSGGRVTLDDLHIRGLPPEITPERIRLRLRSAPEGGFSVIRPGVRLAVSGIVGPPSPPVAPGAFDFQRHAFFEGLGGIGFAMGKPRVLRAPDSEGSAAEGFKAWTADVRQAVTARILNSMDGPENAVAAALMTGERRAVPKDILEAFRDAGLAHLLAISGLHLGLIAAAVFFIVRAALALWPGAALKWPVKKTAALAAALAGVAYAVIAGGTVPTVRAAAMAVLVLIALSVGRRALTLRLVAFAALIVLLSRPESLMGASFQMSFSAVIALVAFYEAWRDRRPAGRPQNGRGSGRGGGVLRRFWTYASGVAMTTLIASAATAPFAVHHFNRVADYGLAANLIAVPVTALWVMPSALAAFAAMPFGLEALPLHVMGRGLSAVIAVAETVSAWPGAATALPALPGWAFAMTVAGALWLCLWRGRWRWWGAGIAAPALAAGLMLAEPPDALISADGEMFAVRGADGALRVSTLRRGRFNREAWLGVAGAAAEAKAWPASGRAAPDLGADALRCGGEGCLFAKGGKVIVFAAGPGALIEDCWRADVIVAPFKVRRGACPGGAGRAGKAGAPVVIDERRLKRGGAHAIWLNPDGEGGGGEGGSGGKGGGNGGESGGESGVRIRAVEDERGARPWVFRKE